MGFCCYGDLLLMIEKNGVLFFLIGSITCFHALIKVTVFSRKFKISTPVFNSFHLYFGNFFFPESFNVSTARQILYAMAVGHEGFEEYSRDDVTNSDNEGHGIRGSCPNVRVSHFEILTAKIVK